MKKVNPIERQKRLKKLRNTQVIERPNEMQVTMDYMLALTENTESDLDLSLKGLVEYL